MICFISCCVSFVCDAGAGCCQEQQYCNADPCGRTPASLLCQRCRIGDADAVAAGGDGTAQEVLVRAVVCSVLAVDGDVESGVIGDSQHKPTVLFHLDVALHGVVAQIIMAQLPGASCSAAWCSVSYCMVYMALCEIT